MNKVIIDFEDTQTAYQLKTTNELQLAKTLFSVLQSKSLSKLGRNLLKFSIDAHLPVDAAIKATLFKQFIGGNSIQDTQKLIAKLGQYNVGSILDYSLEGINTEAEFDKAVDEFIANVKVAANNKDVPFSVFKPSAIASHKILGKVSDGSNLSSAEKEEYQRVRNRFTTIFKAASQLNVTVMIDAEESWIQKAIDDLALEMMQQYNKQKVIAMNTFQMYRHDRLEYLKQLMDLAKKEGFVLGVKLVRGAYMEKERERAYQMGYESPINKDKAATDAAYDAAVFYCLNNIHLNEVFIGTHNENSVAKAAQLMSDLKIEPNDNRVWFSQLYGMCDYITFNLGAKQYNVAKYIPYGPVKAVIPYLVRRADENSSVTGQAAKELGLIKKELKRR